MYGPPTAFVSMLVPRVIKQDAAHDLRRYAKEVGAILPPNVSLVNQTKIGLVDEGRCLQCMPRSFPAHVTSGDAVQFFLNQWYQGIKGCSVTVAPGDQKPCDFSGGWH
jgi:hypothetical protein